MILITKNIFGYGVESPKHQSFKKAWKTEWKISLKTRMVDVCINMVEVYTINVTHMNILV